MKKNYNPYTVPEGFFGESRDRTIGLYDKRARTMKCVFLSAVVAAVLIVIPLYVKQGVRGAEEAMQEYPVNNPAQMYDYDIFLQVNF